MGVRKGKNVEAPGLTTRVTRLERLAKKHLPELEAVIARVEKIERNQAEGFRRMEGRIIKLGDQLQAAIVGAVKTTIRQQLRDLLPQPEGRDQ